MPTYSTASAGHLVAVHSPLFTCGMFIDDVHLAGPQPTSPVIVAARPPPGRETYAWLRKGGPKGSEPAAGRPRSSLLLVAPPRNGRGPDELVGSRWGQGDRGESSPDLVHAYQELAGVRAVRLWDYAGAMAAADEALTVAEGLGMPAPPGAYEWRSEARACLGDPGYVDDYERALALAEAQGAGSNAIARLHHNQAHIIAAQRGPAAAIAAFEENIEFARRRGMEFWVSTGRCSMTSQHLAAGEWGAAREEAAALAPALLDAGWGEGEELAIVRSVQAALMARTGEAGGEGQATATGGEGRAAEATRLIAWLPEQARQGVNDALLSSTCLVAAAELCACKNENGAARDLLARCLEGPEIGPWGPCCEGSPDGLLPRAVRVALRIGDVELARRFVEAARPLSTLDEHGFASSRALLAEARGEADAAAEAYAEAARRWHDFGVPYEEAQALLGRGRCLLALGERERAAPALLQAQEIFARLGAGPALAEVGSLLHGLAHVESTVPSV